MKHAKILIAAAAVLAVPAAIAQVGPVQPAPSQNADLASVQAHLRAVATMTADFTQTDRSGKVLTGKLTMKRPGKVRFQYQQGVPILVIADGNSLWFIDYQVSQVQRWPIGNSPLAALLDPSRDLTRFARVVPTDSPSDVELGRFKLYEPFHFHVYRSAADRTWTEVAAPRDWTAIRFLFENNATPVDNGARWRVPIRMAGGKSIWLEFQFERPLPSFDDWPSRRSLGLSAPAGR
jgi:outer membrane lipoprotein-sorting protein